MFSLLLISSQSMIASAEEYKQASESLGELRVDDPTEAEVMLDAYSPGIEMRRTWLESRSFLTVYTVRSDRPAWVVFRADEDGLPGAILHYIFVGSGTHTIARVEDAPAISSEQIHVMLHEDFGRSSVFEFPGPDGPVYVDNKVVDLLCCGPY
ncbi:MAG: hypothetical protein SCH68_02020 [Brevefilum sp.]|nr:hypothetical protein [Brevefilum sp.]